MPPEPSEKQLEVLRFLIEFIEQNGYQPTHGEMAEHFDVSKNAIQGRLKELARRGLVEMPADRKAKERAVVIKHVKFRAGFGKEKNE